MKEAKKGSPVSALVVSMGRPSGAAKAKPEPAEEPDKGAELGSDLLSAVESGDGEAVYYAIEAIVSHCKEK